MSDTQEKRLRMLHASCNTVGMAEDALIKNLKDILEVETDAELVNSILVLVECENKKTAAKALASEILWQVEKLARTI